MLYFLSFPSQSIAVYFDFPLNKPIQAIAYILIKLLELFRCDILIFGSVGDNFLEDICQLGDNLWLIALASNINNVIDNAHVIGV